MIALALYLALRAMEQFYRNYRFLGLVLLMADLSDSDGHTAPVPGHHQWLLQEGEAVVQAVLDVDVGGVPGLKVGEN